MKWSPYALWLKRFFSLPNLRHTHGSRWSPCSPPCRSPRSPGRTLSISTKLVLRSWDLPLSFGMGLQWQHFREIISTRADLCVRSKTAKRPREIREERDQRRTCTVHTGAEKSRPSKLRQGREEDKKWRRMMLLNFLALATMKVTTVGGQLRGKVKWRSFELKV